MTGETSSLECAHQLGKLCENRHLVVNLIPYNATDVKDKLQCPSLDHMQKFREIVASYGTFCTIRRTMGADIASACGQLVQKSKEAEPEALSEEAIDIEDVVGAAGTRSVAGFKQGGSIGVHIEELPGNHEDKSSSPNLNGSSSPWLEPISSEDLERWSNRLLIAAAISASCFFALAARQLRRR